MRPQQQEIQFLQNNIGRNQNVMISCLEQGLESKIDFILFQEPWIYQSGETYITISHPSYTTILPENTQQRPRVAIFYRKLSKFQYY